MADISIDQIRQLRDQTGAGLTDAKKALTDASGDFDKALAALRQKGFDKVAKRTDRAAGAGLIGSYVHDGRIGVLVEVNCETDFVAKTDEFKELVKDLTLHIAAADPKDVEELMDQPFVKDPQITAGDYVKQHAAKVGENLVVKRFERYVLGQ